MHTFCEESGVFSKIYKYDTDFSNMSGMKKIKVILSMFGHFIIGKHKEFCKKLMNTLRQKRAGPNSSTFSRLLPLLHCAVFSG